MWNVLFAAQQYPFFAAQQYPFFAAQQYPSFAKEFGVLIRTVEHNYICV